VATESGGVEVEPGCYEHCKSLGVDVRAGGKRPYSVATREAVLQKCLVRIAPRDREVGDAFRAIFGVGRTQG
jgi:hypothetical protein